MLVAACYLEEADGCARPLSWGCAMAKIVVMAQLLARRIKVLAEETGAAMWPRAWIALRRGRLVWPRRCGPVCGWPGGI